MAVKVLLSKGISSIDKIEIRHPRRAHFVSKSYFGTGGYSSI
jgi:hypothetical protein